MAAPREQAGRYPKRQSLFALLRRRRRQTLLTAAGTDKGTSLTGRPETNASCISLFSVPKPGAPLAHAVGPRASLHKPDAQTRKFSGFSNPHFNYVDASRAGRPAMGAAGFAHCLFFRQSQQIFVNVSDFSKRPIPPFGCAIVRFIISCRLFFCGATSWFDKDYSCRCATKLYPGKR